MNGGHPIKLTTVPPTEPALQPSTPTEIKEYPMTDPIETAETFTKESAQVGYGPVPTAQGVRGYRDLTEEEVLVINTIKEVEEHVADAWGMLHTMEGVDARKLAIARTHFQEGFSAMVGAVAKPRDPFEAAKKRHIESA